MKDKRLLMVGWLLIAIAITLAIIFTRPYWSELWTGVVNLWNDGTGKVIVVISLILSGLTVLSMSKN